MTYYPPKVMIPIHSIMAGIGFTLQGLRLWVRTRMLPREIRGLHASDYLSLIGCLVTAACAALQLWSAVSGTAGNVATDKTAQSQYRTQLIVGDVQPMIEPLALGANKLSLILFYRNLFRVIPFFLRISQISAYIVVAWTLAFFIAQLSICGKNLPDLWNINQDLAAANCGDKGALLLVFALTSVLTDLLVILLPVFCLKKLRLNDKKKLAVSGIFMIGFVATIACLLRFIFLCIAYHYGTLKLQNSANKAVAKVPGWVNAFNPSFWITIEMWTSSWAANLLALGPLLSRGWLGRRFRSSYNSSNSGGKEGRGSRNINSKPERSITKEGLEELGGELGSDEEHIMTPSLLKNDSRGRSDGNVTASSLSGRTDITF